MAHIPIYRRGTRKTRLWEKKYRRKEVIRRIFQYTKMVTVFEQLTTLDQLRIISKTDKEFVPSRNKCLFPLIDEGLEKLRLSYKYALEFTNTIVV